MTLRDEARTLSSVMPAVVHWLREIPLRRLLLAAGAEFLIAMLGPVVWFLLLVTKGGLLGDPLWVLHDHPAWKDEFVAKWPFAMLIAGAVGVGVFLDVLQTRKPDDPTHP